MRSVATRMTCRRCAEDLSGEVAPPPQDIHRAALVTQPRDISRTDSSRHGNCRTDVQSLET